MKILITNLGNTYNYGSMMMGEILIDRLATTLTHPDIFVQKAKKRDIERLRTATGYNCIYQDEFYDTIPQGMSFLDRFQRFLAVKHYHRRLIDKYDLVIVLGGDDYSEFYLSKLGVLNMLHNLSLLKKQLPVFMIGQTIGPFTGIRKKYASRVFSKIPIYVRDRFTKQYLEQEFQLTPFEMRDLAFLDLPKQGKTQDKTDILNRYRLKENDYIVWIGTELGHCYCDETLFEKQSLVMLQTLRARYPDKTIVWLSHVVTEGGGDNRFLDQLQKKDPAFFAEITIIREVLFPLEARLLLGASYFVNSFRMHAAVSAFQCGKPAICFSYSPKYRGVIAEGLGFPSLVIEAKGQNYWEKQILTDWQEKIDLIATDYYPFTKEIPLRVRQCQKLVEKSLTDIIEKVKYYEK